MKKIPNKHIVRTYDRLWRDTVGLERLMEKDFPGGDTYDPMAVGSGVDREATLNSQAGLHAVMFGLKGARSSANHSVIDASLDRIKERLDDGDIYGLNLPYRHFWHDGLDRIVHRQKFRCYADGSLLFVHTGYKLHFAEPCGKAFIEFMVPTDTTTGGCSFVFQTNRKP